MNAVITRITLLTLVIVLNVQAAETTPSKDTPFNLTAAAEYLESRNGHALLVIHKGEPIYETYFNGHQANKAHRLASGTKSFSGVIAVMAEEDGLLDLDQLVAATLTEWKDDPGKSNITIRQLISLSSGIAGGDNGNVPSGQEAVELADATAKPGASFSYGPIPFQAWGELLRRKLEAQDETVEAYMQRKLFKPIGMKVAFWRKDEDGSIQLPSGTFVTAREWAKFGRFILDGGKWSGEPLVDLENLQQCFKGSVANPRYGLTFWLNRSEEAPKDMVMAAGKGKQKLYIVPSKELLIVQLAEAEGYNEQAFLERFFSEPGTLFKDQRNNSRNAIPSDPDDATAVPTIQSQPTSQTYRLRLMDTNNDQQLDKEEAKDWRFFDEADANHDGITTSEEIRNFLRSRRN